MPQKTRMPLENLNPDSPRRGRDERDPQTTMRDARSQILRAAPQSASIGQPLADLTSNSHTRKGSLGNMSLAEPAATSAASKNLILSALPSAEYEALAPHLSGVNLALGQVLYEQDEIIPFVYFPMSAVVSSLNVMENGDSLEVGIVGSEGIIGLSVIFGAEVAPLHSVVLLAGRALRLDARLLRAAFLRGGALQKLLLRYTHTTIVQISQSVACNRLHHIEQRLARWLLTLHDHVRRDDLDITHEFIAQMLCVRRAGITDALGVLQRAGMIDLARGRITITDRLALETASCECYHAVKEEFESLYL
jgi:CRP-like cAMP-binding protein